MCVGVCVNTDNAHKYRVEHRSRWMDRDLGSHDTIFANKVVAKMMRRLRQI